jgi:heme A synthase
MSAAFARRFARAKARQVEKRRETFYKGNAELAKEERAENIRVGKTVFFTLSAIIAVLIYLVILLAGCANAATLRFSCTAPSMNDEAISCASSPLLVPGSDSLFVVAVIPGLGLRDSVKVARGQRATFTVPAPAGSYLVNVYARRTANGEAGCDTSAVITTKTGPAKVGDLR